MTVDLVEAGLGVVSLFPLAGRIENLRGFYPRGFRDWFVTLSTVFSLIVYIVIVLHFENLKTFVTIRSSATLAAVLMAVYVVGHLATRGRSFPPPLRAALMGVLLLAYAGSIALLTYTFNVLNQLRTHTVYLGDAVTDTTGNPLPGAKVTLHLVSGGSVLTTTRTNGQFIAIVRKGDVSAIEVRLGEPSQHTSYCRTWLADEVVHDEPVTLRIPRCGG